VILLDGDLQDPSEVIPAFVEAFRGGAEVVLGVRRSRADRGWRRAGIAVFHLAFGAISRANAREDTSTYSLFSASALAAMRQLPERRAYLPGMREWIGFRQATVLYDRAPRHDGLPKQTFRRLARYAVDAVYGYLGAPLWALLVAGLVSLGAAPAAATVGQWLLAATAAFAALQLLGLALVAGHPERLLEEVHGRPTYLVSRRIGAFGEGQG
jgi:dolichol-phosphate mannosyltransferase